MFRNVKKLNKKSRLHFIEKSMKVRKSRFVQYSLIAAQGTKLYLKRDIFTSIDQYWLLMMDYLTESISPGLIFELQLYFLSGTHMGQLNGPMKVRNSRFVQYFWSSSRRGKSSICFGFFSCFTRSSPPLIICPIVLLVIDFKAPKNAFHQCL